MVGIEHESTANQNESKTKVVDATSASSTTATTAMVTNKKQIKTIKQGRRSSKVSRPLVRQPSKHPQTQFKTANRKKTLRRSLSYDTLPRMKNQMIILQPLSIQRRIVGRPNSISQFPNKSQSNLVLVCLAFLSFTSMLAMALIAPFFPTESAKKGMREFVNGLVFSVYALVYMIFSPIISIMIPLVGTKMTLIIGILIAGVANILFGLLDRIDDLDTFTVFCFVVRAFEAIGGTAFSTSIYTILMEEFPDSVGTAFSIVETSFGLGLSLGPAIGGFLYSIGGYGLPFFVLGGVILANIPLCLLVIRDSKNCKTIKSPTKAYIKLLSIVKVAVNTCVIVVVAQLLSFLDPTVEPHLREIGLDTHYVSLVFLILSATYTISSPFIGWISNMVPNKFKIMAIGLFMLGIEFLFLGPAEILYLETSFTQTAIIMALIGISYSIAFIPTFETLLGLSIKNGFPDDVTTYSLVSGLWSAFCSLGEILGPMFGGILTENFNFKHSSTIMGIMALTMAVICGITCIYYDDLDQYSNIALLNETKSQSSKTTGAKSRQQLAKSNHFHQNNLTKKGKRYKSSEMIPLLA